MIAYRASDIKLSWEHHHNTDGMPVPKTCGYVKEGLGMSLIPYAVFFYIFSSSIFCSSSAELEGSADEGEEDDVIDEPNSVWLTDANGETTANTETEISAQPFRSKRTKRQADQYEYTPTKTRCPLLLVADYRFFQEMGGGNTKTTINYLVRNYVRNCFLNAPKMKLQNYTI